MADRLPILSAVTLALEEPPGPTGHLAARSSPGGLLAAPLPIDTAQNLLFPRARSRACGFTAGWISHARLAGGQRASEETVIFGLLTYQPARHGLLAKVRDLGSP